jgi:hypothetical protein
MDCPISDANPPSSESAVPSDASDARRPKTDVLRASAPPTTTRTTSKRPYYMMVSLLTPEIAGSAVSWKHLGASATNPVGVNVPSLPSVEKPRDLMALGVRDVLLANDAEDRSTVELRPSDSPMPTPIKDLQRTIRCRGANFPTDEGKVQLYEGSPPSSASAR